VISKDLGVPREEAEALLVAGGRWKVTYCLGGGSPERWGAGLAALPREVLDGMANEIERRRVARGKNNKTYFYAHVEGSGSDLLVHFVEG
jgi:hypothetical protein